MSYLPPIPSRPPPDEDQDENSDKGTVWCLFLMHIIGK